MTVGCIGDIGVMSIFRVTEISRAFRPSRSSIGAISISILSAVPAAGLSVRKAYAATVCSVAIISLTPFRSPACKARAFPGGNRSPHHLRQQAGLGVFWRIPQRTFRHSNRRIVHFSAVEPHKCLPPPRRRPGLASRRKYHKLLWRGLWGLGGRSRGRGKDDSENRKLHHPYYLYRR